MPNHVRHIVKISGPLSEVKRCRAAIQGNDPETNGPFPIDFQKIIPMPPHIYTGDPVDYAKEKEDGPDHWYNWRLKHWETKWNAYDQKDCGDRMFIFETAWSHPAPIFTKLSEQFPKLKFKVRYADEDRGRNLMSLVYEAGIVTDFTPKKALEEFSPHAEAFASRVWSYKK